MFFLIVHIFSERTPSLILGPVCSYAAHGVNEFAKYWNIPMITSGAMAMAFTQEIGIKYKKIC